MRKIAIFLEGETELLFVRKLLFITIDNDKLSFECVSLGGRMNNGVYWDYNNPSADVHFLIFNAGCDGKIISAINDRGENLFRIGFDEIISLRDLYCQEYRKNSPGAISEQYSNKLMEGYKNEIEDFEGSSQVKLYFAIMEIEAWFLSMYSLLVKLSPTLTTKYILKSCKFDLMKVDPQNTFFKPSNVFGKILQLINWKYDKSIEELQIITGKMDIDDIRIGFSNGRCDSLKKFFEKISTYN